MIKRFEDKKRRHMEAFKPLQNKSLVISTTRDDMDYSKVAAAWLQEYEHPSSAAAISVEGKLLSGEIMYSSNPTSGFVCPSQSESNTSVLNATNDSVFKDSTLSAASNMNGKHFINPLISLQSFNLGNYGEARLPFGKDAITSTPLKMLGAVFFITEIILCALKSRLTTALPHSVDELRESSHVGDLRLRNISNNAFKKVFIEDDLARKEHVHSFLSDGTQQLDQSLKKTAQTETILSQIHFESETAVSKNPSPRTISFTSFYEKEIERNSDCEIAKKRFEKGLDRHMRSNIKRTITEKVTVYSKKMATKQEINKTAAFFTDLFSGVKLNGFNDQSVQLCDHDSICYAYQVAAEHYMGVVERDLHLVDVVGAILFRLCINNSEFESILLGKIMTTSCLLTLDINSCTAFATDLSSQSNSDARIRINREKSIIRLFITLHTIGSKETNGPSRFNAINLWRCVAFLLNTQPIVLSTVVILNQIIEVANSIMRILYPKQWSKILQLIKSYSLPSVESSLHTSHLHQTAGEANKVGIAEPPAIVVPEAAQSSIPRQEHSCNDDI
uniref:GLE1 RNA export mediator n=1 Tax=Heterorhabditis bacteriophora TaxID=37862 RepID=A0A1I7XSX1_HETBA